MDEPGLSFPSSWACRFEVANSGTPVRTNAGLVLESRPEYKAGAKLFDRVLKTAAPIFDQRSEDGCVFRIYRLGSVEVRSTQDFQGEETVAAVFSVRPSPDTAGNASKTGMADQNDKIKKVIEYVEVASVGSTSTIPPSCHYYVVYETEGEHVILTELLKDGQVLWTENPKDLELRNSFAKAVCCSKPGNVTTLCVSELKQHLTRESAEQQVHSKHYAQAAYNLAIGEEGHRGSCFTPAARKPSDRFTPPERALPSPSPSLASIKQEVDIPVQAKVRAGAFSKQCSYLQGDFSIHA